MIRLLAKTHAGLTLVALFTQTLYCESLNAESNERPNFVLILADDLGYRELGSFGHKN